MHPKLQQRCDDLQQQLQRAHHDLSIAEKNEIALRRSIENHETTNTHLTNLKAQKEKARD